MSPLQRESWLLFSLWQNLFVLCIQTSFLILKNVISRLADVHRGYDLSPASGFVLQFTALRSCSKSHFNWWFPVPFPPFLPEEAGMSVGLALGDMQWQWGPSDISMALQGCSCWLTWLIKPWSSLLWGTLLRCPFETKWGSFLNSLLIHSKAKHW